MTRSNRFSLTDFEQDGISGPLPLLSPVAAREAYDAFFEALGMDKAEPKPVAAADLGGWHLKNRWAYELATHPAILGPMREILGPDLVLWAMRFWYKEPRSTSFIPWHQDIRYWPMDPPVNATCWVALGPSTRANGCLRVIPGTHTKDYGHLELATDEARLNKAVDPAHIDEARMEVLEMTPGEGVFFSERLFHSSEANTSDIPRVAFSLRFTTPEVKFGDAMSWEDAQVSTMLVSGEDRHRKNERLARTVPDAWLR